MVSSSLVALGLGASSGFAQPFDLTISSAPTVGVQFGPSATGATYVPISNGANFNAATFRTHSDQFKPQGIASSRRVTFAAPLVFDDFIGPRAGVRVEASESVRIEENLLIGLNMDFSTLSPNVPTVVDSLTTFDIDFGGTANFAGLLIIDDAATPDGEGRSAVRVKRNAKRPGAPELLSVENVPLLTAPGIIINEGDLGVGFNAIVGASTSPIPIQLNAGAAISLNSNGILNAGTIVGTSATISVDGTSTGTTPLPATLNAGSVTIDSSNLDVINGANASMNSLTIGNGIADAEGRSRVRISRNARRPGGEGTLDTLGVIGGLSIKSDADVFVTDDGSVQSASLNVDGGYLEVDFDGSVSTTTLNVGTASAGPLGEGRSRVRISRNARRPGAPEGSLLTLSANTANVIDDAILEITNNATASIGSLSVTGAELLVDGAEVTAGNVTFAPSSALAEGRSRVRISRNDRFAGETSGIDFDAASLTIDSTTLEITNLALIEANSFSATGTAVVDFNGDTPEGVLRTGGPGPFTFGKDTVVTGTGILGAQVVSEGTFAFTISSATVYDQLRTTGAITLNDAVIAVSFDTAYLPSVGTRFDLLAWPGLSGTYSFSLPALYPGASWSTSASGGLISITVIPEPATLTALAGVALLVLRRRVV